MQTLDFEKNENGNIICDGNGNAVQGFSQLKPFQMKAVTYHCEKHGEVPCNVLIMNGVPGEPYCPICEKEKEKRLEDQHKKDRMEKEASLPHTNAMNVISFGCIVVTDSQF